LCRLWHPDDDIILALFIGKAKKKITFYFSKCIFFLASPLQFSAILPMVCPQVPGQQKIIPAKTSFFLYHICSSCHIIYAIISRQMSCPALADNKGP